MPFNGSGGFTRVRNWVADAAAKIKIKSDFHDQEDDNFASGLSNTICKDGQTTITADIPWNGKKILNLANPTNLQDAATKNYADSIRSFATGTTLTGASTGSTPNFVSTAWLGFTEADMSIVARKADPAATPPTINRLVINDRADGTGSDVFTFLENGTAKVVTLKTTSGTYTKPAGLKYLLVEGVSAGGGSSGANATAAGQGSCSAGAGGGAWGMRLFAASELAASVPYTIGAGGVGTATSGTSPGGTTDFGASTVNCTLPGGLGGTRSGVLTALGSVAGGLGGAPNANWTIGVRGSSGGTCYANLIGAVGTMGTRPAGGNSRYGVQMTNDTFTGNGDGTDAGGYGSGGGGSCSHGAGGTQKTGGSGTSGMLIFTEYF